MRGVILESLNKNPVLLLKKKVKMWKCCLFNLICFVGYLISVFWRYIPLSSEFFFLFCSWKWCCQFHCCFSFLATSMIFLSLKYLGSSMFHFSVLWGGYFIFTAWNLLFIIAFKVCIFQIFCKIHIQYLFK